MKPGMQRDMLAAFLLLFDEFEIGDGDPDGTPEEAVEAGKAAEEGKPHANDVRSRRRS